MEDRKVVLLKACMDLLKRQEKSSYILNLLSETTFYDGVDCDGLCLLEDIEAELSQSE